MLICPECPLSGVSDRPQSVIEFQKLQPILGSRPGLQLLEIALRVKIEAGMFRTKLPSLFNAPKVLRDAGYV